MSAFKLYVHHRNHHLADLLTRLKSQQLTWIALEQFSWLATWRGGHWLATWLDLSITWVTSYCFWLANKSVIYSHLPVIVVHHMPHWCLSERILITFFLIPYNIYVIVLPNVRRTFDLSKWIWKTILLHKLLFVV